MGPYKPTSLFEYHEKHVFKDPENQVYAFGPHQFALYYWLKAYEEGLIEDDSLLIHIDTHSDFLDASIDYKHKLKSDNIIKLIDDRIIENASFIKPALGTNLISHIFFCCNPKQRNRYGKFGNCKSPVNIARILTRFSQKEEDSFLCRRLLKGKIILDIDLDFFLRNGEMLDTLKNDNKIINEIKAINTLFDYAAVTTIATSPEIFIGNDHLLKRVIDLFSQHFKIKIDFNQVTQTP